MIRFAFMLIHSFLITALFAKTSWRPAPEFKYLASKTEKQVLSGKCTYFENDSNQVHCNMISTMIMPPEDSTLTKGLKNLDSVPDSQLKGRSTEYRDMCDSTKSKRYFRPGPSKKSWHDSLVEVCTLPFSVNNFKHLLKITLEQDHKTCFLHNYDFEVDLKRVAEHKWISDSDPGGLCGVSNVITLDSKDGYLWNYSQTTVSIADDTSKFCKPWATDIGTRYDYTWNTDHVFDISDCDLLDFGYRF